MSSVLVDETCANDARGAIARAVNRKNDFINGLSAERGHVAALQTATRESRSRTEVKARQVAVRGQTNVSEKVTTLGTPQVDEVTPAAKRLPGRTIALSHRQDPIPVWDQMC